jgi:hypothetical protein
MKTDEMVPTDTTPVPSDADLVIAYLLYAVKDVRALSARSTQLLEGAIATLIEETREKSQRGSERAERTVTPRSSSVLC